MKRYIVLGLCLTMSICGSVSQRVYQRIQAYERTRAKRNYEPSYDMRYMLQHPTVDSLTQVFTDALKARNHRRYHRCITTMTNEVHPTEEMAEKLFREALELLIAQQTKDALAQREPIKETEIHYVKDEIEGQERENIIRHIHIAQRAIREYENTPEDLIFGLAAVGYLTGLLESPQTRQFVDITRHELTEIEKRLVAQMENPNIIFDQPTRASKVESTCAVQDAMSVQDKTVITKEGDRIYTKKIKRIQVKNSEN
ncbi:hypothetical protein A3F06_01385 [candidate division TM6 bacterium RIFCSPHIGHO2_12_FULL_36_22]|nr:MAG: hypothetical protein A3F06_01385 [candidate division TM6 bacterium RIFCSPHIGHO2_12_FULL_36_22]